MQTKNDENFFILGNETKETQESVQKITEIVGGQLKLLQTELLQIKGVIASITVCNVHLTQSMIFMQQIRDYVDHLGTLYTHINILPSRFLRLQNCTLLHKFVTCSWLRHPKISTSFPIGHNNK